MTLIRPSEKADYPALSVLVNRIYTDHPQTPDEMEEEDLAQGPKAVFERWVAEENGIVVGQYTRNHDLWDYDARTYSFFIDVDPAHQRKGIGKLLYAHMLERIPVSENTRLQTWVRENNERGILFLEDRGFCELMREAISQLDLESWDESAYKGIERRLEKEGITIRTLAELSEDPKRDEKLYDFERATVVDVPGTSSIPDFATWRKETLERSTLLPDGYFIAVHGDTYVGSSYLAKFERTDTYYIDYTGVRREYRRRGIATVLKAKGCAYAKAAGCPVIETGNEVNNEAILSINIAMGFRRVPGWIRFEKRLFY